MSIDEVRSLVAERQRYDDWLTALDARRTETPSRVFDRVHDDYVARRDAVMTQLREHVGPLSTNGDELDSKLSTLEAELATLEDERMEAMLRTAVGEYDDNRWEVVRQDVEAKIASIGQQRGGLLAEVDEIRALLASASSEPVVETVEATSSIVSESGSVEWFAETLPDTLSEVPAATHEEPHEERPEPRREEASVLTEVVADVMPDVMPDVMSDVRIVTEMPELLPAPEVVQVQQAEQAATEFDDALAMFADATGIPDPTFVRSLEGIEVEHDGHGVTSMTGSSAPQANTATVTPSSAPSTPPADASDAFDDLAFLRSVIDPTPARPSASVSSVPTASATSEPLKTLRCTECSTMNLPTEWYCERCGGELAAF